MCGRYYIDEDTIRVMGKLHGKKGEKWKGGTVGEICPSQLAVVLTGRTLDFCLEEMTWGFPQYQRKGLLINARAETVLERRTFRDSVLHRRCVILARHFYEWDPARNKVTFFRENEPVIYMAGFYDRFQDGDRFVILTTRANASVSSVHDRMPLLLEEKDLRDWLYDDSFLQTALRRISPALSAYREYEQQSLF